MVATFSALHFLLAFALAACLVAELVLLRTANARLSFPTLAKIDAGYGLSAILLVAVGFYRAVRLEKGWAYYSHSWPFLMKLGLFVTIALLSIYPTIRFVRARRGDVAVEQSEVKRIRAIIQIELVLLAILIVCASLAAKGVGFRA